MYVDTMYVFVKRPLGNRRRTPAQDAPPYRRSPHPGVRHDEVHRHHEQKPALLRPVRVQWPDGDRSPPGHRRARRLREEGLPLLQLHACWLKAKKSARPIPSFVSAKQYLKDVAEFRYWNYRKQTVVTLMRMCARTRIRITSTSCHVSDVYIYRYSGSA